MNDKKLTTSRIKSVEDLISKYEDILKNDYNASDIFERMLKRVIKRMREDPLFTVAELITCLCMAYDEKLIYIINTEMIELIPHIYKILQEKGLKIPITTCFVPRNSTHKKIYGNPKEK